LGLLLQQLRDLEDAEVDALISNLGDDDDDDNENGTNKNKK